MSIGSGGEKKAVHTGWSRSIGDFIEEEYFGTQSYIESIAAAFRGNCDELDVSHSGAAWTCRVKYATSGGAGGDVPADEIRMTVNRVQKSIFTPPYQNPAITDSDIIAIKDALEDSSLITGLTTAALELYELAQKEEIFRIVYQPVIVRTRIAEAGYSWPDQNANVGYIHSQAAMLSDGAMAGLINFELPSTGAGPTGFYYGWLKHMPYYDISVGQRSVEVREYEYGLWSTALYGTVT